MVKSMRWPDLEGSGTKESVSSGNEHAAFERPLDELRRRVAALEAENERLENEVTRLREVKTQLDTITHYIKTGQIYGPPLVPRDYVVPGESGLLGRYGPLQPASREQD